MLEILFITLFFETAYLPDFNIYYGINEKERDILELDNAFVAEAGIDILIKDRFFIKGSMKVLSHRKKNELAFYPDCEFWKIAAGIRHGPLEIGWEHECYHPDFPYSSNSREWEGKALINQAILEGGYDRIYARFELKGIF